MRSLAILTLSMMVALTAFGDDITVTDFTSGTTISSSDMNANFDVVVAESNENDGRIATNASQISALSSAVSGKNYTFLGYTSNNYVYDSDTNRISVITLNNFCKSEFNNATAQVASLDIFASISSQQSIALPTATSLMIASSDNAVCMFSGNTSYCSVKLINSVFNISFEPDKYCSFSSYGEIGCGISNNAVNHPVVCVTES